MYFDIKSIEWVAWLAFLLKTKNSRTKANSHSSTKNNISYSWFFLKIILKGGNTWSPTTLESIAKINLQA